MNEVFPAFVLNLNNFSALDFSKQKLHKNEVFH